MKRSILLCLITALMSGTIYAQNKIESTNKKDPTKIMINCGCGNAGKSPLIIIDGKVVTLKLNELNPDNIKSVSVLKDASATAKYGPEGADGVVLITTKNAEDKFLIDNKLNKKTDSVKLTENDIKIILRGTNTYGKDPLYFLDGKIMEEGSINDLDSNKIESISVLKDASAFALYGKKGQNGVILVTTKKEASQKIKK